MKRFLPFMLLALASIVHAADHLPPYLLRAEAQVRVTGACSAGNAIRVIASDGSVTCQSASGGGGGGGAWGDITGTLSDQTDLQAALDLKVPTARTVNGHALSSNVTVTAADVGAPSGSGTSTGTNTGDQDLSAYLLSATAASTYQPLDSDLTAIAALTTTSNGRGFLALADAAAGRTYLGLGTLATQSGTFSGTSSGTNTGDQDLSGYLLSSTAASTYQPLDSDLTAFAGLAIAADKLPYGTGSHTLGLTDLTAAGRALLDDADASAQRTTLGLGTLATSSAALPVTIAQSSHLWLDSYTSGTGLFTASRPACADISDAGTACTATIANYLTTASAASTYVPQTTTVNGQALSGNVTVSTITGNAATATALATGRTISITGDLTYTSGSFDGTGNVTGTGTLANIPTATPAAGSILATAIAAPSTPAAGKGSVYVDSTSKNIAVKDDAGVVKHGVQTDTGTANNYISAISDAGAITKSRPTCSTLSDSGTGCSATIANYVPTTTTVAGHALSSNVAVSCGDLSDDGTACTASTGTSGATIPLLNGTNTWSGAQSFNSSDLILKGATSGTITLNAAGTAGSNTLTLPAGTTDFSGTGGTSQVVKQTSSGGAFTVARLACADLSNAATSCSTDTTSATNITSGTLPAAQLPTGAGGATVRLAKVVTASSASSISFTSISGSYTDLKINCLARATGTGGAVQVFMKLNSDGTSGNYKSGSYVLGNGTTTSSASVAGSANGGYVFDITGTSLATNPITISSIAIPVYSGTTLKKGWVVINHEAAAASDVASAFQAGGQWLSTSAITRIDITAASGSFLDGSTCTLYGEG